MDLSGGILQAHTMHMACEMTFSDKVGERCLLEERRATVRMGTSGVKWLDNAISIWLQIVIWTSTSLHYI